MKLSTVLDVFAAAAIAGGVGLIVGSLFGLAIGAGAGVLVLGCIWAGVSVWNAK